jgi:CheY-like chemotaxis protein
MTKIEQLNLEDFYSDRTKTFQKLMRFNVRDILLVSSLYDSYIIEEDGRLYELIRKEYEGLNLSHSPEITHISSGEEALELAASGRRFDLIITTLHIDDLHAVQFARKLKESGLNIPVVLLTYDNRELSELMLGQDTSVFDRIFIWQGDSRILVAIIKYIEDQMNVEHDTQTAGVQSIILVEDNVKYYSVFLPIIYTEILIQSQRLIAEGINPTDRYLRMRARPKILLCTTYEEAWEYFEKYEENILGIISDIDFYRNGTNDPQAGLEFAKNVKLRHDDIAILLQSNAPEKEIEVHTIGVSFLLKDSPTLLHDLRLFMNRYFSFGDFIFRMPDGTEVGRASDLKSLEENLERVPDESIRYHSERNHFSNWLKARTEFWLAHKLRPRKVTDYSSILSMRADLIASLQSYRRFRQLGQITDFNKSTFDSTSSFARIGSGSLGGKARGLGFINTLISNYEIRDRFKGVQITVPPAVILGTDVFDQFLDENNLREFALRSTDDEEITRRFLKAKKFPRKISRQLGDFLDIVREPLAVRSSSLLEDSQFQPFAGVYKTYMIPNNHTDAVSRRSDLINSIKRVYASTFYQNAKDYIKVTSFRLEEEKMAIIVQKMVGSLHDLKFYPDFSGVAKSYNFYPIAPQKSQDGIVLVSLGLGKMIADGGITVRFCPKYPDNLFQFYSVKETLRNSQTSFFALDLESRLDETADPDYTLLKKYELNEAENDGTLSYVGSTYSPENDTIHDGLSRDGKRVVTFAPILRNKIFPLPEIVELLLEMGNWGMGTSVELEFAVNMSVSRSSPKEFALLQIRPLVLSREAEELEIGEIDDKKLVCHSHQVLGHGIIKDIYDVVMVEVNRFDRSKTNEVAIEIGEFNQKLVLEKRPYLLIGLGRWGSLDPWLGIPVKWQQIAGARIIIEAGFKDIEVAPSQGSHFFQNITSFMVGYFTVTSRIEEGFVDWEWLLSQNVMEEKSFTKHLRLNNPLVVKMNGQKNEGIILKPEK